MGIRSVFGIPTSAKKRSMRLDDESLTAVHVESSATVGLWQRLPGIVLTAGALVLFVLFMTDARFRVNEVTIIGVTNLSEDCLRESLSLEGDSIFGVGENQISRQLMELFPTLETVSVACSLPNEVVVTVQESDVVMVWESEGRYWWIGGSGRVYGETGGADGLPLVHDVAGIAREPGSYLPLVPVGFVRDMATCLGDQPAFDYTPDAGLLVYASNEQIPVMLGHDGQASTKIAVLEALLSHLGTNTAKVAFIDLRNEDRPVYRLTE